MLNGEKLETSTYFPCKFFMDELPALHVTNGYINEMRYVYHLHNYDIVVDGNIQ